jgi:uncharacterized membrane protein
MDGVVKLWELQMLWRDNALTLPPTLLIFSGCILFFCFTSDSIREFDQSPDIGGGKLIN